MSQDERGPEQIQAEIEATREQLGDTVAAVAEKADVKGQARERVADLKQTVRAKKEELLTKKDELLTKASSSPDSAAGGAQQVKAKAQAQQVKAKAQEKPLPFAIGGALLVGFVLGRMRR